MHGDGEIDGCVGNDIIMVVMVMTGDDDGDDVHDDDQLYLTYLSFCSSSDETLLMWIKHCFGACICAPLGYVRL